ncbi:MAG: GTP-binding protein [Thermoanaerobacterales bacterium]|nr:GTP-binding protein [Thermoanaerobacterales bacterium]
MKTKIDIVSGFLGAGKTTLINKILTEISGLEKIVIIENEFGEIGVDADILEKHGVKIREINSGCICCTLYGNFVSAMNELIAQYVPDRIVIEPSGIGKLSDVIKACQAVVRDKQSKLNMLIAVVDSLKYKTYSNNFGDFFEDQIRFAKTIVLSRTQLADEVLVNEIVKEIRHLNCNANIITKPWNQLNGEEVLRIAEDNRDELDIKIDENYFEDHHHHQHNEQEVFDVWSQKTTTKYSKHQIQQILYQLKDKDTYGAILRGKGIVQTAEGCGIQFDYVSEEINIKEIEYPNMGKIIIIGKDINKSALKKLFESISCGDLQQC